MGKRQKTILQATMSLDIGGAETHIVELSKELQRRGYRVIVASNGGVYESDLNENGIETVNIPMHTRNIADMITSIFKLKKIIKSESIRVVHSHARIPSFLLSILKKNTDFTLLTTAHGVFQVDKFLKVMTSWGDEAFAVSEDIKSYLRENYDYPLEKIHMNINGINLEKFKRKEESAKREDIVHISRLEPDTSKTAYMLIEYGKKNPDQKVIVVGDGKELESLKEKAKDYKNIIFTGKTSDVTVFLKNAALFVGISRAALEAMCYNVPVILSGDYGYMGILEKSQIERAEYNNFTARNTGKLEYESLAHDIEKIRKTEASDYSWYRSYVRDNYSIEKMADNYEKVYRKYLGD